MKESNKQRTARLAAEQAAVIMAPTFESAQEVIHIQSTKKCPFTRGQQVLVVLMVLAFILI